MSPPARVASRLPVSDTVAQLALRHGVLGRKFRTQGSIAVSQGFKTASASLAREMPIMVCDARGEAEADAQYSPYFLPKA